MGTAGVVVVEVVGRGMGIRKRMGMSRLRDMRRMGRDRGKGLWRVQEKMGRMVE